MPSQNDLFEAAGPVHLTFVNWNCPDHQRSVAASLVQGAYVLERDRQQCRQDSEARAPAWWRNFQFELVRSLVDAADSSVFGAVYEFRPPHGSSDPYAVNAPSFVIAFRGTITKKKSRVRDLQLDLQIIRNGLEQTSRFRVAMEAVQNLVSSVDPRGIWLAGHSLGSSMATLAGKNMIKNGINLKAFLFNPPFLSAPLETINDNRVKQGIRIANSFVTAGVAMAVDRRRKNKPAADSFSMLASWTPCLFVNPSDHISSEYIGYFDHRTRMQNIGAGSVGKLATKNSVKDLLLTAFGKESEPLHLLPSAVLTINSSLSPDFKSAHGIHQWWRPDLNLECRCYQYN